MQKLFSCIAILISFAVVFPEVLLGQSKWTELQGTLDGQVWGMAAWKHSQIIATTKSGEILILETKGNRLKTLDSLKVANHVPLKVAGQGGLLDVFVAPNRDVYVTYSLGRSADSESTTAVGRLQIVDNKLKWVEQIFAANAWETTSHHYGSRLYISKSHLYVTVGDRGRRHKSQNKNMHHGKVLKMTLQGKPYDGKTYVWSYGHRNAQGLAWRQSDGSLWLSEHGPQGGDEINLVKKGANYGWPVVTFGREYHGPKIGEGTKKPGIEGPVHYWDPSIAPSQILWYENGSIDALKGKLLTGALKFRHLNVLSLDKGNKVRKEVRMLKKLEERIRSMTQDARNTLLIGTDSGKIYKLD